MLDITNNKYNKIDDKMEYHDDRNIKKILILFDRIRKW